MPDSAPSSNVCARSCPFPAIGSGKRGGSRPRSARPGYRWVGIYDVRKMKSVVVAWSGPSASRHTIPLEPGASARRGPIQRDDRGRGCVADPPVPDDAGTTPLRDRGPRLGGPRSRGIARRRERPHGRLQRGRPRLPRGVRRSTRSALGVSGEIDSLPPAPTRLLLGLLEGVSLGGSVLSVALISDSTSRIPS